ncbi:IS66-like element accessory protein TnpA [Azohydromonas australica]|uniref:IS66-like element accessory protein TnpA n=1 Tax=Azohydromonas australica TaxID=364039 RepID=UPI0003FE4480|nr:transposase [Azohydromonas australica]
MYSRSNPRRRHGAELKAAVLAACNEPGASVAAVAQAHGLNANLVHQWRRGRGTAAATVAAAAAAAPLPIIEATAACAATPTFIPVELPPAPVPAAATTTPAPTPDVPQEIHIELRRGAVTVNVRWPVHAAAQCAAWTREVLR